MHLSMTSRRQVPRKRVIQTIPNETFNADAG